jgi:hypothetical protein
VALGEFLAEERWITTPHPHSTPVDKFAPFRPGAHDGQGTDQSESDPTLGLILEAIADDVHRIAAAAREGIIAEFAARIAHARKHFPRNQLSATLRGLAEARKAALALVKKNATSEIAGRKKAALAARRRPGLTMGARRSSEPGLRH